MTYDENKGVWRYLRLRFIIWYQILLRYRKKRKSVHAKFGINNTFVKPIQLRSSINYVHDFIPRDLSVYYSISPLPLFLELRIPSLEKQTILSLLLFPRLKTLRRLSTDYNLWGPQNKVETLELQTTKISLKSTI